MNAAATGPKYLSESDIVAARVSEPAVLRGQSRSGYGGKIPTGWLVRLASTKREHRVYMMQWSNAGTAYVLVRGERLLLGSISEYELARIAQRSVKP
jgi:hypothetical protein